MAMGNKKRPRLSTQIEEASINDLFKEYNRLAEKLFDLKVKSAFAHRAYTEEEARFRFFFAEDVLMSRIKHQRELLKPFPESQDDPGFVVEFHGSSSYTHRFSALFSAQTFVEHVIDERPFKWADNKTIKVGSLTIRANNLEDIIEYEPTRKEREWDMPKNAIRYAKRIRDMNTKQPREEPKQGGSIKKVDGHMTISQICSDLKIEPRIARGILRKNKINKPYAWKDPTPIIKLLKDA